MTGWTGADLDVLAAFEEAAGAFVDLVAQIGPGEWEVPGLGEWDLRALVGHTSRALVTVTTYLDRPAPVEEVVASAAAYVALVAAVDPAAVAERGRRAGIDLGDDPQAFVATAAARAVTAVRAADPGTLMETVSGGMRVVAYLPTRTFELVVHGLDVATAADLEPVVPDAALSAATTLAAQVAVERGDGTSLLQALTGRTSWPAGLAVVS